MTRSSIRDASPADFDAIVALNLESEQFLSPMDKPRLQRLFDQSACCRVVEEGGGIAAFLLAFREGADYDSENYRWFAMRYPSFLYIDRVVVSSTARDRGHGGALYADLFRFARETGVASVTCEYDIDPPNAASARFHARFGFREVGTQSVGYAAKRVSMQEATP